MIQTLHICLAMLGALLFPNNCLVWEQWNNIRYANISNEQNLSIYLPKTKKADKLPAIILIGNKSWADSILNQALDRGFAAVTINYRSSLEYPFPAAIQDINTALKWIKENGRDYNISPDKLILCGASEGGYLAALAATTGTYIDGVTAQIEFGSGNIVAQEQNAEQKNQNWVESFNSIHNKILCVIDFYGFTKNIGKISINNSALNIADANIQTSPITYVTPYTPPFLIIQGEDDPIVAVKDAENLYISIKNNLCPPGTQNCTTQIIIIPQAGHGGTEFTTPMIMEQIFSFIKKTL